VKNALLTHCKPACTEVFTSWPRILRQKSEIPKARPKSSVGKTTKTGGSDPTFRAFSRPKSLWGRSRPAAQVSVPVVFPTLPESF
jgi:hypothetical protein